MPLRLSPSIARVRRAEGLNYLDVNFTFEDANALTVLEALRWVLHSLAARRTPGWLQVKRSC